MILAADVAYDDAKDTATAAGVVCAYWADAQPIAQYVVPIVGVAPYEPGAFYRRELPCILALLAVVRETLSTVIVDGYVDLEPGHAGLGRHLYLAMEGRTAVVGVAKTSYSGAIAAEVRRGDSDSPLFVTAAGLDLAIASQAVASMHGKYRIPTMLKTADSLSRRR